MLVLVALCVLLPLVAALETCDQSKTAAFLAMDQLEGNPLENFGDKRFWVVAAAAQNAVTATSIEIDFGSVSGDSVPVEMKYRDSTGTPILTLDNIYTLDGDHLISNETNSIYLFKCSTNLIGGYRCQEEGTTGAMGPMYAVWTAWQSCGDDLSAELETCLAKYVEVDPSATFIRRVHP